MLDLTPLDKAVAQLEQARAYAHSDLARSDATLARHLRAATIQAFEFTYELSFKMLRRYLESTESTPSLLKTFSFNRLVRLGYARGLLNEEPAAWMRFREARGITSHTYDERKAQAVFEVVPLFLDEARFLLGRLHARGEEEA